VRRVIFPLMAALLTLSVLPVRADDAVHGVTMTVYNGFSDMNSQPWMAAPEQQPCFTGIVPNIDSDWGGGPAAETCDADFFLVHYNGWLTVPESGAYEFLALVDDGWHMSINEQLINDNWVPKGCGGWWSGPNEGFIELQAGISYALDAWMYEWGGGACAILYYSNGINWGVIPTEWLTTQPLPEPTPEPSIIPPSIEPSIEPTIEPTPTPTEEPTPSQEPSIEPTPTPTPKPTPKPTPEPTPTPTPSPSASPDPSLLPTPEPSVEPSPSSDPVAAVGEAVAFVGEAVGEIADATIGRVTRLGQDLKPEDKKKAQPVAVALIISQVASAATAAATAAAGKAKK
jgi:hypothetical protein